MAYIKDHFIGAMRELHKLFMNALYGRTGMKEDVNVTKIVTTDKAEEIHLSHDVIDNFRISDNKEYIRYHKNPSFELCEQSGIDFESLSVAVSDSRINLNTSTPIAAATAS